MKERKDALALEEKLREEAKKYEDAQRQAQDEYFAKLNEELTETFVKEVAPNEDISTEGPRDPSVPSDRGNTEEYSEQT
jgi:hypothetical protein